MYKQAYMILGSVFGLCSLSLAAYAIEISLHENMSSFILQAAILSVVYALASTYRFINGAKKGHLIIFSYLILSSLLSLEAYLAATGFLTWVIGPLMTFLVATATLILASILRLTRDGDYFSKYFDEGAIFK